MSDPVRKPKSILLRATLIAVPLALLFSAGFLHAQHAMHHGDTPAAAQAVNLDHVHAMLARVGASNEQQQRIDGLLGTVNSELQAAQQMLGDAHRELAGLLLGPTVDPGQIEALRAGKIVALDTASRHMLAAVEDAVLVLTPEQRAKLLAMHQPAGG